MEPIANNPDSRDRTIERLQHQIAVLRGEVPRRRFTIRRMLWATAICAVAAWLLAKGNFSYVSRESMVSITAGIYQVIDVGYYWKAERAFREAESEVDVTFGNEDKPAWEWSHDFLRGGPIVRRVKQFSE